MASLSGLAGSSTADSSSDWVALFFHSLIRFAWSPWCSSWKLLRCVRQNSQVGEEGLVCYREFLVAFLCVVPASSSGQAVPMVVVAGVKLLQMMHRNAGLRKKMKDLYVILELCRGPFVKREALVPDICLF